MTESGTWQLLPMFAVMAAAAAMAWATFSGQHRHPRQHRDIAWLAWHWFTGGPLEPLHSYPGTGTRTRRIARHLGLGALRTAGAVALVAAFHVRSGGHPGNGAELGAALAAYVPAVTIVAAWLAVRRSTWRHYIRPLHWAVAGAAGWDLDMRPRRVRRYIKIRHDEVMVQCGPSFEPRKDAEKRVVEIVTAKLGLTNMIPGWKREGLHRYVEFTRQDPVPANVAFRDVRELIERESTSSRVLLGLTRGGIPVWLDFRTQAPHVLISAGTGGGKSVALAGMAAQLMWHGAEIVVLDIKRISHLWLRDLPGVRYARDIDEIHRTLIAMRAEVERRTALWDPITFDQREAGQVPQFPRLLIVFDEISSTMGRLVDHWQDIREPGDPKTSPAKRAWSDILNMGRQVDVNTAVAGQRGSAQAVGSGDARENFEAVVLVDRYSQKTWNMLAPECAYAPGVSHAGRAQVVIGATATETQLLHIRERDAQRWVIERRPSGTTAVPQRGLASVPGETVGARPLGDKVEGVTLWEAATDTGTGIVTLRFQSLKKAAQRDRQRHEFPDPVDDTGRAPKYDPADLRRWQRNRVQPMPVDGVDRVEGNERDGVEREDKNTNESLEKRVPGDSKLQPAASLRDIDIVRFWQMVSEPDDHGCRPWLGAINGDGYGYFKLDGKSVPAHRIAYLLQKGHIPVGHTIDHLIGPDEPCTTKACMEGSHLEAVTREENTVRRWERGQDRNELN